MKYDFERWSKEATLVLFDTIPGEDAESLHELLSDAIAESDFLKVDLTHVKLIAPVCGEILFSFSGNDESVSKRLLIFRRRNLTQDEQAAPIMNTSKEKDEKEKSQTIHTDPSAVS